MSVPIFQNFSRTPAVLLLAGTGAATVAGVAGWWYWKVKHPPAYEKILRMTAYDAALAEEDYAAGRRQILVFGLNPARPPLPAALSGLGLVYVDLAGCAPPLDRLPGALAYNNRMRDLVLRDTGLDLQNLPLQ